VLHQSLKGWPLGYPVTSVEAILYAALYAYAALGFGYMLRRLREGSLSLEP